MHRPHVLWEERARARQRPDRPRHRGQSEGKLHVTNTFNFARKALRGSTALQAIALLGAGVGMTAIATPASAQDYSNVNANGRVQGTDGKAIAGATVTATSNDQGFTRTVTTGDDGTFRIGQLPQGSYTFTVEASGYDSFTDNAVTLTQGQSANQFTLAAAGAASGGEVVVTAGRIQVVDFDRNTTGAVINVGELATRVPVARDINSIVQLAPGTTTGDTAFAVGGSLLAQSVPSIAGASVSENTYFINGLNITNFRNGIGSVEVPFDFYQTVEVKNGGISAEFGRLTGGFINATTKSGSNEYHGGILFNWSPDDLRDKPRNTYAQDNDSSYSERKDFVAQLSGPIIKDHLFFYGIYQSRDVQAGVGSTTRSAVAAAAALPVDGVEFPAIPANANQRSILTGTQYVRDRSRSPFYGGKIDAVIVDGQRLEFTYFDTSAVTTRDIFGTTSQPALGGRRFNTVTNDPGTYAGGVLYEIGGENYVGRYTGSFTEWLTLSAAYGRSYNRDNTISQTPDQSSIIDSRTGGAIQLGNPTANTSSAQDRREFYRADADVYVNLLGNHHFRFGYDRENLRNVSSTLANGNYQVSYFNSGAAGDDFVPTPNTQYVERRFFRNGGLFTTKGEAFYAQDSWTLFDNRLALNLGVRNDKFENKNGEGQTFYRSGDLWAPRVGFSFDPTGDGQTKVYGSFSRYYLPVATNTNVRLAGPELDYTTFNVLTSVRADGTPVIGAPIQINDGVPCPQAALAADRTGGANCTINSDGTTPPFASLVSSNLKAQSRDEYILGFERRLGRRVKLGAFYTQRKLNESLEDAYIDAGVIDYCRRNNIVLNNRGADNVLNTGDETGCADIFNGAHQYSLLNPGRDVTVVLDATNAFGQPNTALDGKSVTLTAAGLGLPKAQATYKSMTFTFDREFDGKWSLSANYTLSALVGNIEGGVRSDNGQVDSGLTTAFDYPALVNGAYGYLPGHRRHNIKVYGSYQLFDFLNVGANVQVQSPRKFGCIGAVPAAVDGGNAAAYGAAGFYCNVDSSGNVIRTGTSAANRILTPRGSQFQSDWLYNVNLDLAFKIPTDAFDGTLRASVFNVLNQKQALDYQEVGTAGNGTPSALYQQPLTYQAPRSVRFQFGVNF